MSALVPQEVIPVRGKRSVRGKEAADAFRWQEGNPVPAYWNPEPVFISLWLSGDLRETRKALLKNVCQTFIVTVSSYRNSGGPWM